ncbi:hypothetical protein SAMN05216319_4252 [Duganella sp. CF402]|uniref:hypothetical protein n=1 Tax=unclassified Duganella TaxID=2636909 RepID=UPI0008CED1DF|nr:MULTISPECIES: hypothetical protein [unclassified Duganella]RZT03970.1 hypothetical protein EV582_4851 [Duganella sp. BK701]SEM53005.1 hypothetical protein SAMN05216319_4252 [Duganella sp. CF402]
MLDSFDMAENKTQPGAASVDDYLAARASGQQAADCRELSRLFEKVTGSAAVMWGPSIVGFGAYTYTYESGRSGTAPLAGYAIRGFKQLADLDLPTLQQLAAGSVAEIRQRYG